jgi:hypothetical protein
VPHEKVIYRSKVCFDDLDGDGKKECFAYAISDGEILDAFGLTEKDNKLQVIEKPLLYDLILQTTDGYNLSIYSTITGH